MDRYAGGMRKVLTSQQGKKAIGRDAERRREFKSQENFL